MYELKNVRCEAQTRRGICMEPARKRANLVAGLVPCAERRVDAALRCRTKEMRGLLRVLAAARFVTVILTLLMILPFRFERPGKYMTPVRAEPAPHVRPSPCAHVPALPHP